MVKDIVVEESMGESMAFGTVMDMDVKCSRRASEVDGSSTHRSSMELISFKVRRYQIVVDRPHCFPRAAGRTTVCALTLLHISDDPPGEKSSEYVTSSASSMHWKLRDAEATQKCKKNHARRI